MTLTTTYLVLSSNHMLSLTPTDEHDPPNTWVLELTAGDSVFKSCTNFHPLPTCKRCQIEALCSYDADVYIEENSACIEFDIPILGTPLVLQLNRVQENDTLNTTSETEIQRRLTELETVNRAMLRVMCTQNPSPFTFELETRYAERTTERRYNVDDKKLYTFSNPTAIINPQPYQPFHEMMLNTSMWTLEDTARLLQHHPYPMQWDWVSIMVPFTATYHVSVYHTWDLTSSYGVVYDFELDIATDGETASHSIVSRPIRWGPSVGRELARGWNAPCSPKPDIEPSRCTVYECKLNMGTRILLRGIFSRVRVVPVL